MTPNTWAGPSPSEPLGFVATPPQAAELRTSKKYEHESKEPTKDTVACDGSASRSHRKDIIVDFVRDGAVLFSFRSPGHGDPWV